MKANELSVTDTLRVYQDIASIARRCDPEGSVQQPSLAEEAFSVCKLKHHRLLPRDSLQLQVITCPGLFAHFKSQHRSEGGPYQRVYQALHVHILGSNLAQPRLSHS